MSRGSTFRVMGMQLLQNTCSSLHDKSNRISVHHCPSHYNETVIPLTCVEVTTDRQFSSYQVRREPAEHMYNI